jgi:nucleotide-binding universal stress UspA family protein
MVLNNILVPLDGSALAECVLPHVVALAEATQAQVTLLHVLEQESGSALTRPVDPVDWHLRRVEADAYLTRVHQQLSAAGVQSHPLLLQGAPAEKIIEQCQNDHVRLLVLSSHGRSGLSEWNVSSVVQKVILRALCSILLVRAYQPAEAAIGELHYRRILVPLDGSLRSEYVLPLLSRLSQYHQPDVLLVHVVARPEMIHRAPPTAEDNELVERLVERNQEEATRYLGQIKSRVPGRVATRVVVAGSVPNALHELVAEEHVDLVVMSAHGYTCAGNQPYGTIGTALIAYGATPLLVVQDLAQQEAAVHRQDEAGAAPRSYTTVEEPH